MSNKVLGVINFIHFFFLNSISFLNYIYNNIVLKNVYINTKPISSGQDPVSRGHSSVYVPHRNYLIIFLNNNDLNYCLTKL